MISVVIPTHNRKLELECAVKSIFNQTLLPQELIIIDDGSNIAITEEIFAGAPKEISLKLLRNEEPKGANDARNRGIKEASGDWIAFLDDDDEFLENKVQVLKESLLPNSNERFDLLYHPALINLVNEQISYVTAPRDFNIENNIFKHLLLRNEIGGTPMVAVRREKLIEVGLFDTELPALQDRELWLRLAKNNIRVKFIPEPLTRYNYITESTSVSKNLEANDRAIKYIFEKYKLDYAKLTNQEINKFKENILYDKIRRSILNGNSSTGAKLCLKGFKKFKNPKYLSFMVAVFLGVRITYSFRGLFNKKYRITKK